MAMPKVDMYNQKAHKISRVDLNPRIFSAQMNPALMAQAVRVRLANARLGTQKTKSRGEVSGGGRKPWRQKHLGKARHGSIRSPLWVGGGHAHPIQPRDYTLSLPKKMRRRALFSALSQKQREGQILLLEKLDLKEAKTKKIAKLLTSLPVSEKVLLVIPSKDEKIELSIRNLRKKKVLEARLLNTYDVLNYDSLIFLKDSLKVLEETFVK